MATCNAISRKNRKEEDCLTEVECGMENLNIERENNVDDMMLQQILRSRIKQVLGGRISPTRFVDMGLYYYISKMFNVRLSVQAALLFQRFVLADCRPALEAKLYRPE